MKKTLAALAVLGAFAGSAMAADVTLYGLVDYGFSYEHVDGDTADKDAQDTFQMKSGQNSGSRFGLKGTEDLGNGLKVGFVLENGFTADDGKMDNSDRLFGRESNLFVTGAFGTLSFGRVGQLASSNGSYGLLGRVSPFSSGWGDSIGTKFVTANGWTRFDNTVTYVTPAFAGAKVYAQYSFQNDSVSPQKDGVEGQSSVNRYYGIGATYDIGDLQLVATVDSINYASYGSYKSKIDDDSLTVTVGGNYNFGVVRIYAMGQYFDNASGVGQKSYEKDGTFGKGYVTENGLEGYGFSLGAAVPAFGGTFKAHVGYMDAEDVKDSDIDGKRWNIAGGYDYSLSKRTSVYAAAAYTKDDLGDRKPSATEVIAGLIHKF